MLPRFILVGSMLFLGACLREVPIVRVEAVVRAKKQFVGRRVALEGYLWLHPEERLLVEHQVDLSEETIELGKTLWIAFDSPMGSEALESWAKVSDPKLHRRHLPHVRITGEIKEGMIGYVPMRGLFIRPEKFELVEEETNQSPELTRVLGTSAAEQPLVPSTRVAHL